MTARQEAYQLINALPDDSVSLLVELLKKMLPAASSTAEAKEAEPSAAVRFGLGKGILTDPSDFDRWDAEIADMFEGGRP